VHGSKLGLWCYTDVRIGPLVAWGGPERERTYGDCAFGSFAFAASDWTLGVFLDLRDSLNTPQTKKRARLTMA
jgi:hypothetical protein